MAVFRRRIFGSLLCLTIAALCGPAPVFGVELAAIADSLDDLRIDFTKQYSTSNLTIERAGVRFTLGEGTVSFAQPVAGKVCGGVFLGKARLRITPPNSAERHMFYRHCSDSLADWEIKEVSFLFTDSTFEEIGGRAQPVAQPEIRGQARLLTGLLKNVRSDLQTSPAAILLPDLLQPQLPGRFVARFQTPCGHAILIVDDKEVEEILLLRAANPGSGAYPDVVGSWHAPHQYSESPWGPAYENKDLIDSLDYRIDCKIWPNSKCDLNVELAFESEIDSLSAITFSLFHDIDHKSMRIEDSRGDSLFWLKDDEESAITVFLRQPLAKSEPELLRFHYSSEGMLESTPWGTQVLVSSTTWHPRYGYLKRCRFRLKFTSPKHLDFVAVGDPISTKTEGEFLVTEWDLSDYRVSMVSYNLGGFTIDTSTIMNRIPLAVYRSGAHRPSTAGMMKSVVDDVRAATTLFAAEVHPYPFPRLIVTEIPSAHGQGMPGLIHLAHRTFDEGLSNGFDDAFRAHEVAHQWWGHVVGWKSYHDQWLSEAFAEYFAGWYVQRKSMNDPARRTRFFELLDQWRDDVFQKGALLPDGWRGDYQVGNEAGPIWMGYRLASSKSSDYTTLVYSKGAYVLYMLRMMMFDFAKRDDSKFRAMLDDFLTTYAWREASTADFQKVAEAHYGQRLDWFFNQWIYGTELPEFEWRPIVTQQPDGRWQVEVTVTTKNVSPEFQMPIPLTILMTDDYHTTTRLFVDQPTQKFMISDLPHKPEKFVFNSFRSVLCKEKQK